LPQLTDLLTNERTNEQTKQIIQLL